MAASREFADGLTGKPDCRRDRQPARELRSSALIRFDQESEPAGTELFRVALPGVIDSTMPLAIDSHDDIYVAGRTLAPISFPFTHLPIAISQSESNFVVKLHGQDGTIVYATD